MGKNRAETASRKAAATPQAVKGNGAVFMAALLDMSWRLAIVVLVPIVGGFELDEHFGIAPVLTIIGFLLAMAGVFVIMKRTVATADEKFKSHGAPR